MPWHLPAQIFRNSNKNLPSVGWKKFSLGFLIPCGAVGDSFLHWKIWELCWEKTPDATMEERIDGFCSGLKNKGCNNFNGESCEPRNVCPKLNWDQDPFVAGIIHGGAQRPFQCLGWSLKGPAQLQESPVEFSRENSWIPDIKFNSWFLLEHHHSQSSFPICRFLSLNKKKKKISCSVPPPLPKSSLQLLHLPANFCLC